MQIYLEQGECLHKIRVQHPKDWFQLVNQDGRREFIVLEL